MSKTEEYVNLNLSYARSIKGLCQSKTKYTTSKTEVLNSKHSSIRHLESLKLLLFITKNSKEVSGKIARIHNVYYDLKEYLMAS